MEEYKRDNMIVNCPECGAKNQTDRPPEPGKRYRCGKCGAVITLPRTADVQASLEEHKRDTMFVKCPECGAKNQTARPPEPGKRYRCGKCGAVITFPQTADIRGISAEVPKKETRPEVREEAKKEPRAKTRKRIKLFGYGLIAVIIIVVLIFTYTKSPDEIEQAPPASTQAPTETPAPATEPKPTLTVMAAEELYAAYKADKVAADAEYKDEMLNIMGVISTVAKDVSKPYVLLTGAEHEVKGVQCMFDIEGKAELAQLKKGHEITIQGRCDAYLMNVIMRDCTLVR